MVLAREREEREKKEGKWRKREENISLCYVCLDIGKKGKKKMWEFYISFGLQRKETGKISVFKFYSLKRSNNNTFKLGECLFYTPAHIRETSHFVPII